MFFVAVGNLQLPNPVSLFIDFEFYDLEAAVSAYKTELDGLQYILDAGISIEEYTSFPQNSTIEEVFCKGWIPFAGLDGSDARYLAMDTMPGSEGLENQIIVFGRDIVPHVIKVADSLDELLAMLLQHLESHQVAKKPEGYENCFLSNIFRSHNI